LSILLTDPPILPNGVTAVYIAYQNFHVHSSRGSGSSAWHPFQAVGTTELVGLANSSKTIAVVSAPVGSYDQLMLNLTSAVVTYGGKNYTALLRIMSGSAPMIG
jgi:hypothetical protein